MWPHKSPRTQYAKLVSDHWWHTLWTHTLHTQLKLVSDHWWHTLTTPLKTHTMNTLLLSLSLPHTHTTHDHMHTHYEQAVSIALVPALVTSFLARFSLTHPPATACKSPPPTHTHNSGLSVCSFCIFCVSVYVSVHFQHHYMSIFHTKTTQKKFTQKKIKYLYTWGLLI